MLGKTQGIGLYVGLIIHLSMLSPTGGGGPRAYLGHLTSIAFPILGNLTKNLLGWRRLLFLRGGVG